MVTCTATLTGIAAYYVGLGTYIALTTANPGSGTTVSNEATGGSPAYARVATVWTAGSAGIQNGSAVTINVAAGTYTYMALCSAASGNNMIDNGAITAVTMGGQGQLVVTPLYQQT